MHCPLWLHVALAAAVLTSGCAKGNKGSRVEPFERLTPGMTVGEVVSLMGEPKERGLASWIKAIESGNNYDTAYPPAFKGADPGKEPVWLYQDKQGTIILLSFTDGKLVGAERHRLTGGPGKMLENQAWNRNLTCGKCGKSFSVTVKRRMKYASCPECGHRNWVD